MKSTIGVLDLAPAGSIQILAVKLPEGNFLVKSEKEAPALTEKVVATYDPQDQFCTVISLEDFAKQQLEGYTVVGYYLDNNQPWIDHVKKAKSPKDAALKAIQQMLEASEHSVEEDDLFVVEVIKGTHQGCLGNETSLNKPDMEKGARFHGKET